MANYKQIQNLLDKYFRGGMEPTEQAEFEIQLHNDPLMQGEFELQKDIVEAIKDSRRKDIKGRLDQIKVGGAQPFSFMNVAASVTLATVISVGSYLYFEDKLESESAKFDLTSYVELAEKIENDLPAMPEALVKREAIAQQIVKDQTPQVAKEQSTVSTVEEVTPANIDPPQIFIPAAPDELGEVKELEVEDDLVNNTKGFDNVKNNEVPSFEIENVAKAEMFHYQFYDGKLYLYGNFDGAPYNIIEFKADNKRKVFLNYNDAYYLLNLKQKETAPLTDIKDQTLIKELEMLNEE
jgi:hypothetical protein